MLVCPKSKTVSGTPPEVSDTFYRIRTNPKSAPWKKWGTRSVTALVLVMQAANRVLFLSLSVSRVFVCIGVASIFAAGVHFILASRSDDLFSRRPQNTSYPPKLTTCTSPSPAQ